MPVTELPIPGDASTKPAPAQRPHLSRHCHGQFSTVELECPDQSHPGPAADRAGSGCAAAGHRCIAGRIHQSPPIIGQGRARWRVQARRQTPLTCLEAAEGYARRAVRRIIRRSGVIAIWNLSTAASRHIRVRPVVVSDGIGGAVPLADGRGRVGVVLGRGAVVSGMAFPFAGWAWRGASDRQPLGERPAGTGRQSRAARAC